MSIPILQALISLSQFAPSISKWVNSSKLNDVSEKVIDIAKNITSSKNEHDAIAKLKTDKNMLLKFQKEILLAERDIELAIIDDKKNARSRDIAIINSGKRNKRADTMVIAAALGLIICLMSLVFFQKNMPGEAVGIISTIAGIFGSCLKDAYNFEFGSSRGSKEKDHTVATFIKNSN